MLGVVMNDSEPLRACLKTLFDSLHQIACVFLKAPMEGTLRQSVGPTGLPLYCVLEGLQLAVNLIEARGDSLLRLGY